MKMKSTMICMLMVLAMVFQSFACVSVFAENLAQSSGIYTIADFGTVEGINNSGFLRGGQPMRSSVEQAYGDANTSVKIDVDKVTTGVIGTEGINWNEYAYLRLRIYAEKTGDQFTLVPVTNKSAVLTYNPYMTGTATINKTGWHDITFKLGVDFSKIAKPLKAGEAPHTPAWNEITAMYMDIGGFSNTYTTGSSIYVDSIWLEKSNVVYKTERSQIKETDKVLTEFNSVSNVVNNGKYPQTTNARTNGNEIYDVWTIKAEDTQTYTLYNSTGMDLSKYTHVNLWLYSPEAQDGGIVISFAATGGWKHHTVTKAVDWKGWKLFSIPIGQYTNVTKIMLYVNGFIGNGWDAKWFNSGWFGIEKIWFSDSAVTDPNALSAPTQPADVEFASDAYLANAFASTANLKDKGDAALRNVKASVDNNNNYGMTGRFAWDIANDSKQQDAMFFKAAGANNNTSDLIKNTKISPEIISKNDYNYANFLVYNPGKKYIDMVNKEGQTERKTSALNFIALYGGAPDNSNFSGNYSLIVEDMDWKGWKVVSIPLDAKADTNGIYSLYVNAGGWSTPGWSDIGNYIDVDNVWLSKDAYADNAFVASTIEDNATNVSSTLGGNNTVTYTFSNYIAPKSASEVAVYENYTPVDPQQYNVVVDGKTVSVVFNKSLTEKSLYTVKFSDKFADAYGVKLEKPFSRSFTIEDLYMNSEVLTIENGTVNGFKGMTLADVRKKLTYSNDAVLTFTDGKDTIADETKLAERGMYAVITKRGQTKSFKLEFAFANATNFKYFMDGTETNEFKVGKLKVTADAYSYVKNASAPMTLIIAQYKGDELLDVKCAPHTINGSGEISVEIDLKEVSNTKLSVFVWDSADTLYPVITPITFNIG